VLYDSVPVLFMLTGAVVLFLFSCPGVVRSLDVCRCYLFSIRCCVYGVCNLCTSPSSFCTWCISINLAHFKKKYKELDRVIYKIVFYFIV
jgi:hypothetical protein